MEWLLKLAPSLGTTAVAILFLFVVHRILERGGAPAEGHQFRKSIGKSNRPINQLTLNERVRI